MLRRPIFEFWYEFASPYSYLAAMRIEQAAEEAGVELVWRPFLLGTVFKAQGWETSPFNLYPAKGRYMWRDMEREAVRFGLPLCKPNPFPQNSLLPARIALLGLDRGWTPVFSKAVYMAEFGEGRDISEAQVLSGILSGLGLHPQEIIADAQSETNKTRLRRLNDEALSRGIFGAPAFIAEDGEMFWGNDRLEQALDWAATQARRSEIPL